MLKKRAWIIVVLIVVALGMIIGPIVSLQSTTKEAQKALVDTEALYQKTSLLYESQKNWFKESYLSFSLKKPKEDLVEAKKIFSESSGFGKKIASNKKSISMLKQTKLELDKIWQSLKTNDEKKKEAFDLYSKLGSEIDQLSLNEVRERFEKESNDFLEKYKRRFLNNFSLFEKNVSKGNESLKTAGVFLPKLDSKDKQGDPLEAIKNLEVANKVLSEARDLVDQSIKDLDYQIEAKKNVSLKLDEALQKIAKAKNVLIETEKKYKFSKDKALYLAYLNLDKAIKANENASNVLKTLVEGNKIDYVVAYDMAKSSIDFSQKSTEENNVLITSYENALTLSKTIGINLSMANETLFEAKSDYNVLLLNHNRSCWSNVFGMFASSEENFLEGKRLKILADQQMSFSLQKFVEANENYKKALNFFDESKKKGMEIISLTDVLESYRNQWYGVATAAELAIDDEKSLVSQYGSYNSSAKSDYDRSISLLTSARAKAMDQLYEEAVDLAKQASVLVSDTGRRCKNSYEDDQDSNNNFGNLNNNGGGNDNFNDNNGFNGGDDGGGWDNGGGDDGGGWNDAGDDGGGWDNGGGDDGGGWGDVGGDDGGAWGD